MLYGLTLTSLRSCGIHPVSNFAIGLDVWNYYIGLTSDSQNPATWLNVNSWYLWEFLAYDPMCPIDDKSTSVWIIPWCRIDGRKSKSMMTSLTGTYESMEWTLRFKPSPLSAAYMRQGSVSVLVQAMAASHYLKQCWVIVNLTRRNELQWNLNQNTELFIQENASENIVCEMAAILSRGNELKGDTRISCGWPPTNRFCVICKSTRETRYL